MTVYDGERFITDAVQSILDQTYSDFEFIIVDNYSMDRTLSILEGFTDERIKIIRNSENLGQAGALNVGITNSKGELIARMDADDISIANRLQI